MNEPERAWIDDALRAHGLTLSAPIEGVELRPWARVYSARTSAGRVYFKAAGTTGHHEPALVQELASRWPEWIPSPLACECALGWMLSLDHGARLVDTVSAPEQIAIWSELLPVYAEIQVATSARVPSWLELGLPDRRASRMPGEAERLIESCPDLEPNEREEMRGALPDLRRICAQLAKTPLPDALDHGDLHGGNILLWRGRRWIIDWADACITHPFATLLVTCSLLADDLDDPAGRDLTARLRDAYLEPWSALVSMEEARRLFRPALWMAHIGRASNFELALAGTTPQESARWRPGIARWLRRWSKRRSWADELD